MSFKKGSDKKKLKELFIGIDSQIPPEEYRAFSSSILGCNTQKIQFQKLQFFNLCHANHGVYHKEELTPMAICKSSSCTL